MVQSKAAGSGEVFTCVTPQEAHQHHLILSAALQSHESRALVSPEY
jgi:hypothetical protein